MDTSLGEGSCKLTEAMFCLLPALNVLSAMFLSYTQEASRWWARRAKSLATPPRCGHKHDCAPPKHEAFVPLVQASYGRLCRDAEVLA
jgi:hypothetical protein